MGRNCKICGTNIIPYPLSTGFDCGDPKYLSFYCENSTGQLIFMRPNNTYYQVTSIRPEAKEIASSDAMKKLLEFNQDSPFLVKSGCTAEKSTSSLYPFSDAEWFREIQIEWSLHWNQSVILLKTASTGLIQIAIQQEMDRKGVIAK